jgi:predicted nucleic acid-binding protein
MSIINWGEIYYSVFLVQGKETAQSVFTQIGCYPIEVVDADRSLTYDAAKLKGKFKITYADCFAAALAHRLKAKVLTGDPEFRKLEGAIEIEWII